MSATAGATAAAAAGSSSSHAATTAAAISGATNIAAVGGSMFSGHKNRKLAREQMRFNARQAEKANEFNAQQAQLSRQWQEDFYNKYQSPEAQIRQKLQAGYNPYSDVGNPGSAPSAPVYSDAVVPSDNSFSTAMDANTQETQQILSSLQSASSVMREILSLRQMQAETEKTEAETNSVKQQWSIGNYEQSVMDMELEESDLMGLDHYGVGSKWYQDFVSKYNRKPKFADMHWQAVLQKTFRDMNQTTGLGSNYVQDPMISLYKDWLSGNGAHKGRSFDFADPEGFFNSVSRDDSNSIQIDEKDKYELLSTLMYKLVSGNFDAKNQYEQNAVKTFMDNWKKERSLNGLPTDTNSAYASILSLIYARDPQFVQHHINKLMGIMDQSMSVGEGLMEGPLTKIQDLVGEEMSTVLDKVYEGLKKVRYVGHAMYRGTKSDLKKRFGRK